MSRSLRCALGVVLALAALTALPARAADIHVTITADEDLASGGTGCSLREAMKSYFSGVNYGGCTGAVANPGPNKIVFDLNGTFTVSTPLPDVTSTAGTLTIDGSGRTVAIACTNSKIFIQQANSTFNLSNLSIGPCTAAGAGIAITSTNATALSLTNVTVTGVKSNSGGDGGAINLSGGSLTIANSNFTGNETNGTGNGGAMALSGIDLTSGKALSMTNVNFTSNKAGKSGGAIYLSNGATTSSTLQLTNCTFNLNSAAGSGAQVGGGAIWAATGTGIANVFLVTSGLFTANEATNGAGGAILLTLGSRLAYAVPEIPSAGGIFASSFQLNKAGGPGERYGEGGTAGADGSGGAIYSRGDLTVVQSSFLGNSSTSSSGGAISTNTNSSYSTVLANVTFSGNTAAQNGGALAKFAGDSWSLLNDTFDGNSASATPLGLPLPPPIITTDPFVVGGGIWNNGSTASVAAANTIFSSPTPSSSVVGGTCQGTITDAGNNLLFPGPATPCAGTITVASALLGSASILAGPNLLVWSMEPAATSPALGGGNNAVCNAGPILRFDATGRPLIRPVDGGSQKCDIGAYESSNALPVELEKFTIE